MRPTIVIIAAALIVGASALAQAQGQRVNTQVADACKTEIQQLCQGQKGQAAEQCLKNNQAKLSAQCKNAVSKPSG